MASRSEALAPVREVEAPEVALPGRPDVTADLMRGVARHLAALGHGPLLEFVLPTGRRADVVGLGRSGEIVIVEVKSSPEDYRADAKWPEYLEFCDRFYFAVAPGFPVELLPDGEGLLVADRWGAEIIRPAVERTLGGARRRSLLLRFALKASRRLASLTDPEIADL